MVFRSVSCHVAKAYRIISDRNYKTDLHRRIFTLFITKTHNRAFKGSFDVTYIALSNDGKEEKSLKTRKHARGKWYDDVKKLS